MKRTPPARLLPPRTLLAIMAAFVLILGACGGNSTDGPTETAANPVPTEAPETAATAVVTEPTNEPSPAPPEATATPAAPATSEPTTEAVEPVLADNFSELGPYAVGVTTLRLDDRDVEIWYPANEAALNQPTEVFDALTAFPETLRTIVPPELSGEYDTGAVRDAAANPGGFPVVIYGHGFGGYRQIATHFTSHLASWGFVVASADHLERGIAEQTLDLVGGGLFDETNTRTQAALTDVRDTIELLSAANSQGPLAGVLDLERLAIAGHSAGAFAAVQAAAAEPERIDAWISISGGTSDDIQLVQPGIVIIGQFDAVVPPERSYELATSVEPPPLVLNIAGAGHNSFTDPCRGITDLGGLSALTALLGEEQVARAEDGCTPGATEPEVAQAMQNHVVTAFLLDLFAMADIGDALTMQQVATMGPLADYQAPPAP